ncbi:MAG: hypothetical protein ABSG69_18665 [Candidatus Acidiferrum sp.]
MGILEFFQRRKIRTAFGPYLKPEVLRKLLSSPEIVEPVVRHFQFVLALPDDTNSQQVSVIIGKAINTMFDHDATFLSGAPSLLFAILGAPLNRHNSAAERRALVDALLRENGNQIRIAHRECAGLVGNIGVARRYQYSALIPGFSGILKKLLETNPGTAVEIP